MTLPSIRRTNATDKTQQAFNDDVLKLQGFLKGVPFVDGKLVTLGALVGAGAFDVNHGLGAVPRGFLVLDCSVAAAPSTIYRVAGDTLTSSTLRLRASAAYLSLSLWVF